MELTEIEEKITRLALNDGAQDGERAAAALKLIQSLRARGVTVEDMMARLPPPLPTFDEEDVEGDDMMTGTEESDNDEYSDDDNDGDESIEPTDEESNQSYEPENSNAVNTPGTWLFIGVMTIFMLPFMPFIMRGVNKRQAAYNAFNKKYGTPTETPEMENDPTPPPLPVTPPTTVTNKTVKRVLIGIAIYAVFGVLHILNENPNPMSVMMTTGIISVIGYFAVKHFLAGRCWK